MMNAQIAIEKTAIKNLLSIFKEGYQRRNINEVETFVANTFYNTDDVVIIGTGTGELEIGYNQIIELIKEDWLYWGAVDFDIDQAYIDCSKDVAWFYLPGTLSQSFKHSNERNENYLNFINENIENTAITAEQRIALINWVLTLTYHQRNEEQRDYRWPLGISGLALKKNGNWRIQQLHFAMSSGNYPDERYEHNEEFEHNNDKQNQKSKEYFDGISNNKKLYSFLNEIQQNYLALNKYYDNMGFFISPKLETIEAQNLSDYLEKIALKSIQFNLDASIKYESEEIDAVILTGKANRNHSNSSIFQNCAELVRKISNQNLSTPEKLFQIHRATSSTLMEVSSGEQYSWPFRVLAILKKNNNDYQVKFAHVSCPHYWIFEGKLDSVI